MRTTRWLLVLALLACPCAAWAAWSNDPAVGNRVSSDSARALPQRLLAVPDGAGGMFACWSSLKAAGGDSLAVQRVDARGRRAWATEFTVPSSNDQYNPVLIADGAGGVFVVWEELTAVGEDLRMQHVTPDGDASWGASGLLLCTGAGSRGDVVLAADGAGGFYCAWTYIDATTCDVRAQHVSASGAVQWNAAGAPVCTHAEKQYGPAVVTTADGGLIVTWLDWRENPSSSYAALYAQRLDRNGTPQWVLDGVNAQDGATWVYPRLLSDGGNGAYLLAVEFEGGYGTRVRAQRLGANGAPLWAAGGVALSGASGPLLGFGDALTPSNELVVTWGEYVSGGTFRVWGQKLDAAGTEQWTAGGRLLHSSTSSRSVVRAAVDASGRTWVLVASSGSTDQLLAIPLAADGTPSPGAPITVCQSEGNFLYSPMVLDGAGGMIAVWLDERYGMPTPYAQRVDRWGQLGPQPTIAQVIDAPNDQGGYVQASWTKSPLDTPPSAGVNKYRFWREAPVSAAQALAARGAHVLHSGDDVPEDGAPALLQLASTTGGSEYWEYVGEMLADGRALYTASIATASDSVPGSNPSTQFMIEGRRGDGTQWWYSDPVPGTSSDNLAPASPSSFFAVWSAGQSKLHWPKSLESDFKEYRIYSGDWPNFIPSPSNRVVTVSDTGYTHAAAHPIGYKIVAVDVHGNASAARWTAPSGTTGVGDGPPAELALAEVSPNPVRALAEVRFALPVASRVSLSLYDAQGRRVRALAEGVLPAGEHVCHWSGASEGATPLAAGLYFVRLEAMGRTLTRRVVFVP